MTVVEENEKYENNTENGHESYYRHKVEDKDKVHHIEDSLGQIVINAHGLSLEEKKEMWLRSPLQSEMISKFPSFSRMERFVEDRVVNKDLQKAILKIISNVDAQYSSGLIDTEAAKYQLTLI
jgi:hypothetical protein